MLLFAQRVACPPVGNYSSIGIRTQADTDMSTIPTLAPIIEYFARCGRLFTLNRNPIWVGATFCIRIIVTRLIHAITCAAVLVEHRLFAVKLCFAQRFACRPVGNYSSIGIPPQADTNMSTSPTLAPTIKLFARRGRLFTLPM